MGTVKGLIKGVTSGDPEDSKFVSHPDRISGSSELFTLRSPPRNANEQFPVTDFYECYWANRMRDTKLRHVLPWMVKLLRFPKDTRPLVWLAWIVVWAAILAAFGAGVVKFETISTTYDFVTTGLIGVACSAAVGAIVQKLLIGKVGDAARYLTPNADNVEQRAKIRKEALDLLDKLQKSDRYLRIVLVGHSLGSVIAYDVLSRLWDDYRDRFWTEEERLGDKTAPEVKLPENGQEALAKIEQISEKMRSETADEIDGSTTDFRKAQLNLWDEQREMGNRWLITDLVTLGSPLAHSKYLLRVAKNDLDEKFELREYSKCPPLPDNWQGSDNRSISYKVSNVKVMIPSAVFAQVRWTNLWFPGDVISGKVAKTFGTGVEDVKVSRVGWLASWLPWSHTKYWEPKEVDATNELRKALQLDDQDVVGLLHKHAQNIGSNASIQKGIEPDR
jgi:hypothetical protein